MIDPKLVPSTLERIARCDYEAVFACGECFRFALRLHDRWGYKIRGIRASSDATRWGHVWAVKEGDIGVDIRGVYPEQLLAALANDGKASQVLDASPQELRSLIESREYPPDVARQLDLLADLIIDTHERFHGAGPMSAEAIAFAADLAKKG